MDLDIDDVRAADRFDAMPPPAAEARLRPIAFSPSGRRGAMTVAGCPARALAGVEPACVPAPRLPAGRDDERPTSQTITILVVDDDAVDVAAIRRAFWRLKLANPIVVARNGLEALDMLVGRNGHRKLEAPYLILLDLNMPRMGGVEFLDVLRGDPALRRTLVLVMTTSATAADRELAYEKNVAGFLRKPEPGASFTPAIGALEQYWRAIEFPD